MALIYPTAPSLSWSILIVLVFYLNILVKENNSVLFLLNKILFLYFCFFWKYLVKNLINITFIYLVNVNKLNNLCKLLW